MPERAQLMMPTPDVEAAKLIEIEALRQIADNLRRLNDRMDEHGKTVTDVRERLIRIESNRVDSRVEELEQKVEELQRDKDRRDGAGTFIDLMFKYGPTIFSLLTVLYLLGRSAGVVPAPPPTTPAPPPAIERREGDNREVKQ